MFDFLRRRDHVSGCDATDAVDVLRAANAQLDAQLEAAYQEFARSQADLRGARAEIDDLISQRDALQRQVIDLKMQYNAAEAGRVENYREVERLRSEAIGRDRVRGEFPADSAEALAALDNLDAVAQGMSMRRYVGETRLQAREIDPLSLRRALSLPDDASAIVTMAIELPARTAVTSSGSADASRGASGASPG